MYKKKIHDDQIINTLNRDKARSNPELAQQPLTFLTLISIPIQIERYLQKQERGQSYLEALRLLESARLSFKAEAMPAGH